MTSFEAARLSDENDDATKLPGKSYHTRLAANAATDDKTSLAQEGYFKHALQYFNASI